MKVRKSKKQQTVQLPPAKPGIVILSTQYGVWYWVEEVKSVVRYAVGHEEEAEIGVIITGNDLLAATATACNREYKRINVERKAQAAKPIEV